ncbi:MAG: excinuclease ABC subunit UvrC [Bacteroidia bacterium]|nr:excinuclease ABC subunit UvrC [Bacteroidia bacterium]
MLVQSLPDNPGVYQFFDTDGKILYIGKAKNLKKRVTSYFKKMPNSVKTSIMAAKIADIKHIIVDSETDALLLENNLIKKYQPRYNVLLKDDKSFPWICIKNERFPRVFSTRKIFKDGSAYFGPYTSAYMVRSMLELIRQLFPLRTCNYALSDENISKKNFKICLEYHIKNCNAPCAGLQTKEEYDKNIHGIKNILKGNIQSVITYLKEKMLYFASEQKFEEAQNIKENLEVIEHYRSKSIIVNPSIHNVDVFSITDDEQNAYVNFMKIVDGAVIQMYTAEIKKKLEESPDELLIYAITDIRERLISVSKEIIVPFNIDYTLPGVTFTVPQIGDKLKLLELSQRNVKYYMLEKHKQQASAHPQQHIRRILETIKKDLYLPELPVHIECFDCSNILGSYPVASCVVFKNIKPSKSNYRKYNIKTVEGPDDFASMEEIVFRRYKRSLEEQQSLPQLIVIDGGKGQLNAGVRSLEKLELRGKIAIIGIAKRLEEIYFPGDSVPIYLDKNSETLKIIQQLRNEAHRFGIKFHREKRTKGFVTSELDNIPGIGPKTKELLLKEFKSVARIKKTEITELEKIIGKSKASIIFTQLLIKCPIKF